MAETNIAVQVNITRKDVVMARLALYYHGALGLACTAFGLFFACFALLALIQQRTSGISIHTYLLPAVLLVFLPLGIALGGLYSPALSKWLSTTTYSFTDAGFTVSVPSVNARFDWAEVRRALETNRHIVLTASAVLHIIPLAQLEPQTAANLRHFVHAKVSSRQRKHGL